MNIGQTSKAIMVKRIGGPAQPNPVETPKPVEAPVAVEAESKTLVTA